ncbi:MAG: sugar ABC transporter substrate-binding protein [Firmicutes bacterium]|jgi:ribose transport system substrate-binding protein|nr:sugar ABC transporter substrate-binding protein [Bacillota bacterium]MDD4337851.1 sugar ABC transporter substrate-binding protein [Bacillota bacterium]MDD4793416.1 sugar ABC transporter substrate-binding protein [Bacillota bacterium]
MSKKMQRFMAASVLGILLIMSLGTAYAAPKKYKIGFVVTSTEGEINAIYYEEVLKRIKERGHNAVAASSNNDDEMYIKNVENMFQSGCDAVILGYGRTESCKGVIEQAHKKGVAIAGLYAGYVDGMLFDVAANDFAMSSMMSKYLAERLRAKGGGKIAVIFSDDRYWSRARRHALDAVLKEYPDIKVVSEHAVNWGNMRDDAMQYAQNTLLAHPDIDAFWCCFDLPGLGIAQALQAARRKDVFVVGIDGDTEALSLISKGANFAATVKQNPELIAKTTVDRLVDYLDGKFKPVTRSIDVEASLVTIDNVRDFYKGR